MYQALLRRGLVERLGLRFELSGDGTGDIVGVPAEVRARFSKRRAAIEEYMRKTGSRSSGGRGRHPDNPPGQGPAGLRTGPAHRMATGGGAAPLRPGLCSRSPGRLFAALPTDQALASRITLDDATFDAAKAMWVVAALTPDGGELVKEASGTRVSSSRGPGVARGDEVLGRYRTALGRAIRVCRRRDPTRRRSCCDFARLRASTATRHSKTGTVGARCGRREDRWATAARHDCGLFVVCGLRRPDHTNPENAVTCMFPGREGGT